MLVKLTEIATVLAAVILQIAYLYKKKAGFRAVFLLSIVTIPVMVMSIESMNTFLTCDESYMVYEPLNLSTDTLKMWQLGAFRTTDLVVGLPLTALKASSGFSLDILALFGKSLHWIIGFIVILLIIDNMVRIFKKEDDFLFAYTLLFFAVMLLPTVIIAQKIINYDSLSMLFGTLALVLLAAGWQKGDNHRLYLSIISATLGAQEKLISSPILCVCLCLVPLMVSWKSGIENTASLIKNVSLNSLKAAIIALLTILFTFSVVAYVNKSEIPDSNVINLFYPLISGLWPVLRLAGINMSEMLAANSFNNILYIPVFATLLSLVLVLLNISVMLILRKASNTQWVQISGKLLLNRLPLINYLLFTILLICGMCGTFFIDARLGPFNPPLSGSYLPPVSFNNSFIHFGAGNAATHIIISIFWAYTVFFNAIPTTVVFLALFNAVLFFQKRKETSSPVLEITYTAVLLVPFAFGLFLAPVGNRYFNLFLLLLTLVNVYKLIEKDINISGKKTRITAVAVICLLLIEVLPFRPLYAAFRPVWSNYSQLYNMSPSKGILNPSWMGWGEEISIAGKRIEKRLSESNRKLSGVQIYHNYMGEWLYRKNDAVLLGLDTCKVLGYTENDFYIMNRMGITQSPLSFPENVPPYDVISFRGFVTAWVFRGDDLKKHGFTFR